MSKFLCFSLSKHSKNFQCINNRKNTIVLSCSKSNWKPAVDRRTPTNQQWDADDYRLARFIDKPKHICQGIALTAKKRTKVNMWKGTIATCDGGGGQLGHPKVFYNVAKPGSYAYCHYCGSVHTRIKKKSK